eukprot:5813445-Prymnesium_polylepis.1
MSAAASAVELPPPPTSTWTRAIAVVCSASLNAAAASYTSRSHEPRKTCVRDSLAQTLDDATAVLAVRRCTAACRMAPSSPSSVARSSAAWHRSRCAVAASTSCVADSSSTAFAACAACFACSSSFRASVRPLSIAAFSLAAPSSSPTRSSRMTSCTDASIRRLA